MTAPNEQIVMYIVVRSSLGMSGGKIAAQVGHAVEKLMLRYFTVQVLSAKGFALNEDENINIKLTTQWIEKSGSNKIILSANEDQWSSLKEEYNKKNFVVKDAGKTEVEPGSETVMAFWPQFKMKISGKLRELPLLK